MGEGGFGVVWEAKFHQKNAAYKKIQLKLKNNPTIWQNVAYFFKKLVRANPPTELEVAQEKAYMEYTIPKLCSQKEQLKSFYYFYFVNFIFIFI